MGSTNTMFVFREWVDIDTEFSNKPDRLSKMKAYFEKYKKAITVVDFEGFTDIEDIFSGVSTWEQVMLEGYSKDSNGKTFYEIIDTFGEWGNIWIQKMGFYGYSFNEFYFNEIKGGMTNEAQAMRGILGLDLGGARS